MESNAGEVSAVGLVQLGAQRPLMQHSLYGHMLLGFWRPATQAEIVAGKALLVVRGLRVRIGCHTGGLSKSDIRIKDKISGGRTVYTGHAMVVAKAVSNAAQGGTTVLSGGCCAALLAARGLDPRTSVLLYMGQHEVHEGIPPEHVFQFVNQALLPRLSCLWPPTLRTRTLMPGVLEAPAGGVAFARISLAGFGALAALDAPAAAAAEAQLAAVAWDVLHWQAEQLRVLAGRGVRLGYTGAQLVGAPDLMATTHFAYMDTMEEIEEGLLDEDEEDGPQTGKDKRPSEAAAWGTTTGDAGTTDGATTTDDGGLSEAAINRGPGMFPDAPGPRGLLGLRRHASTAAAAVDETMESISGAPTVAGRGHSITVARLAARGAPLGEAAEWKLSPDSHAAPIEHLIMVGRERGHRGATMRSSGAAAAAVAEGMEAGEKGKSSIRGADRHRGRKLGRSKQPAMALPTVHHPLAGYLAQVGNGSVTAVFTSVHQAAHWALVAQSALPAISWQHGGAVQAEGLAATRIPSAAAIAFGSLVGAPSADGRGAPRVPPSTSHATGSTRQSRATTSTVMSNPSHASQLSYPSPHMGGASYSQLRSRFAATEAAVLANMHARASSPGQNVLYAEMDDEHLLHLGMVHRELSTPVAAMRRPSRSQAAATPAAMLAMGLQVARSQKSLSNLATVHQALKVCRPPGGHTPGSSRHGSRRASVSSTHSSQHSHPQLPMSPQLLARSSVSCLPPGNSQLSLPSGLQSPTAFGGGAGISPALRQHDWLAACACTCRQWCCPSIVKRSDWGISRLPCY